MARPANPELLADSHPELAAQAYGWDPTKVGEGSGAVKLWRCPKGHLWKARVVCRSLGTGCSVCHPHGFDLSKPAYVYLFARPGEQQTGITGNLSRRAREHGVGGWELVDVVGPMDGPVAQEIERQLLRWVRSTVGVLPRWREAWSTADLEVSTVRELANRAGVELATLTLPVETRSSPVSLAVDGAAIRSSRGRSVALRPRDGRQQPAGRDAP
jgi:hypothetical protein